MTTRIKPYHETVYVFDEYGLLHLQIARFTVAQAGEFRRRYEALKQRESERQVAVRQPGEELAMRQETRAWTPAEQAVVEAYRSLDLSCVTSDALEGLFLALRSWAGMAPTTEQHVVSDAEIRRRRLAEMTPAERTAWEQQVATEEDAEIAFIVEAVTQYVTVAPGQLVMVRGDEDVPLTKGEDLLRVAGGQLLELRGLVSLILAENTLTASQKKVWRSLWSSSGSSDASVMAAVGTAPEATADDAAPKGSAGPAGVTEPRVM